MVSNLANDMRPRVLEDVIGQQHLVGEGKILWRMVEDKRLSSILLYGPPGVGKTSIARAVNGDFRSALMSLGVSAKSTEPNITGIINIKIDEVQEVV